MKPFFKILTLLVSTTLSAQMSVAVLDFDGIGISKDEAKALSGRFGTEFMGVSKGVYKIVERNQMGKILEEQGFQNTGIVSSDDAVKMGEALGADFIVSGSISKVGTLFSINARLLNVQSAEVVKSISHDHMGDIVDLMTKGIKESASKLMDLKEEEEAPSGSLKENTNPQQAKVAIQPAALMPGACILSLMGPTGLHPLATIWTRTRYGHRPRARPGGTPKSLHSSVAESGHFR